MGARHLWVRVRVFECIYQYTKTCLIRPLKYIWLRKIQATNGVKEYRNAVRKARKVMEKIN